MCARAAAGWTVGWTVGWTAAGFSLFRNKFRLTRAKQAHPPSANYSPPDPNFGDVMIERKQGENTGAFYRDGAAEQRTQQEKLRRHRRAPHTPRRKRVPVGAGRQRLVPLAPPITACLTHWSFDKFVKRDQTSPHHYVIQAAGTHIHEPINASDIMYGPVYAHRKPRTRT